MVRFKGIDFLFMNHVDASILWRRFVKTSEWVYEKQRNKNIVIMSIELDERKVSLCSQPHFHSYEAIKDFKLSTRGTFLPLNTIYVVKRPVYKIEGLEELQMPSIMYQTKRRSNALLRCRMSSEKSYSTKCFHNIAY